MLLVEVDRVDAEAPQAALAGRANVLGAAVEATCAVDAVAHDPELGGEHHLVAPVADRAPDELLVVAVAVDVGRVQQVDAEVERAVDRGDPVGITRRFRRCLTSACSRARSPTPAVRGFQADAFPCDRLSRSRWAAEPVDGATAAVRFTHVQHCCPPSLRALHARRQRAGAREGAGAAGGRADPRSGGRCRARGEGRGSRASVRGGRLAARMASGWSRFA